MVSTGKKKHQKKILFSQLEKTLNNFVLGYDTQTAIAEGKAVETQNNSFVNVIRDAMSCTNPQIH